MTARGQRWARAALFLSLGAAIVPKSEEVPLVLDVGARRGLNDNAPDWELTAGLTLEVVL